MIMKKEINTSNGNTTDALFQSWDLCNAPNPNLQGQLQSHNRFFASFDLLEYLGFLAGIVDEKAAADKGRFELLVPFTDMISLSFDFIYEIKNVLYTIGKIA